MSSIINKYLTKTSEIKPTVSVIAKPSDAQYSYYITLCQSRGKLIESVDNFDTISIREEIEDLKLMMTLAQHNKIATLSKELGLVPNFSLTIDGATAHIEELLAKTPPTDAQMKRLIMTVAYGLCEMPAEINRISVTELLAETANDYVTFANINCNFYQLDSIIQLQEKLGKPISSEQSIGMLTMQEAEDMLNALKAEASTTRIAKQLSRMQTTVEITDDVTRTDVEEAHKKAFSTKKKDTTKNVL